MLRLVYSASVSISQLCVSGGLLFVEEDSYSLVGLACMFQIKASADLLLESFRILFFQSPFE